MNRQKITRFAQGYLEILGIYYLLNLTPYPNAGAFLLMIAGICYLFWLAHKEEKARQGEKTSKAGPKRNSLLHS